MKVSEAVLSRKSIRAFLKKPVKNSLIRSLLKLASRSPSGGNIQPWKIFVINNKSMTSFLDFQSNWKSPETPAYEIYPPKLKEPYRTSRFDVGEQMYSLLNIARDDKEGRIKQVLKNFEFFGAPAALFCFVDKQMGPPQWSDLGMFLQTFMLLSQEAGLDTCAQESWAMKNDSVKSFFGCNNEDILFCAVAMGYKDSKNPINFLETNRRDIDEWATFLD